MMAIKPQLGKVEQTGILSKLDHHLGVVRGEESQRLAKAQSHAGTLTEVLLDHVGAACGSTTLQDGLAHSCKVDAYRRV